MQAIWFFIEQSIYGSMIIILTGAFLPLWINVNFGSNALADAAGDPIIQTVLSIGYSLVILISFRFVPEILRSLFRSPLIMLLIIWAFFSVFWSVAPDVTLRKVIAVFLATYFGVALSVRLDFKAFINLMAWVTFIILSASVLTAVIMPDVAIVPEPRGEPWRGVFVQKNSLGRMALLGFLVFSWRLFLSSKMRWFWLSNLLLSIFLLYMSDSRTSQINLLMLVLWIGMLWIARYSRKMWPAYLAVVILVIGGLSLSLFSNLEIILQLTGRDLSLTGRLPLWQIVWNYILVHPFFGYGFGAFWLQETYGPSVSIMAGWEVPHSHNGFLDLWLDLGLIGLLIGLLIIFSSFVFWIKSYLQTGSSEALFWSTIGGFFLLYNFVESGFLRVNNVVWVLLVIMHLKRIRWDHQVKKPKSHRQLILIRKEQVYE